jgi:uncharacterized membrane protein
MSTAESMALARVLHVLGVVLWIGGVAFVTTVLIPAIRRWDRYQDPSFWWVPLMTLVWLLFTVVLFILEPLFLHRRFRELAERDSDRAFRILHRGHIVLLTLSLIAIIGAVAGTRGFLRIG